MPAIGSGRTSGSGMKLGANKGPKKAALSVADSVANEWEDGGVEDAWGDDLIDVNADEDDWGESVCTMLLACGS